MRSIIIAGIVSLALSACSTTSIDQTVQKNLPEICKVADRTHETFLAVAAVNPIRQSVLDREAKAYEAMQFICEDAASQTAISVAIRASAILVTLNETLLEAKKVEG